jgi:hypothetical protein
VPAVVVADVVTVKTELPGVVPVISIGDVARVQVAGLVAPDGPVTAQVRATLPVKPLTGVTVMVEVLPLAVPAVMESVAGLLLRANEVAAPTVTPTVAVELILPVAVSEAVTVAV